MQSDAQKNFDEVVEFLKENPFQDRHEMLSQFMDAALDVWNEDVAGEIVLDDGLCVTIQPVIHKGY